MTFVSQDIIVIIIALSHLSRIGFLLDPLYSDVLCSSVVYPVFFTSLFSQLFDLVTLQYIESGWYTLFVYMPKSSYWRILFYIFFQNYPQIPSYVYIHNFICYCNFICPFQHVDLSQVHFSSRFFVVQLGAPSNNKPFLAAVMLFYKNVYQLVSTLPTLF